MLACANVFFPPLFFNSHVYPVCGTLISPLPPPSLPPLHLLSLRPATVIPPPPPPPDGMQSTLLVSEASVTGRMFLSSATAAALSPSVVGLSDALCRPH